MRKKINLYQGEKVLLTSNSSIWFFIFKLFRIFIFIALPLITLSFSIVYLFFLESFFIYFLSSTFIILTLCFIYQFLLWKDPVLIITDKRVIFEHDKSLFSSKVNELHFRHISGINIKKSSLMQTILGYGTIIIMTSSGYGKLEIRYMPDCREKVDKIMEIYMLETHKKKDEYKSIEEFLDNNKQIINYFRLKKDEIEILLQIESKENRGAISVLKKDKVFCVLRNGKINLPSDAICSLPGLKLHNLIAKRFKQETEEDDILLLGV